MQITQEKFNELFDKLGMKPSASLVYLNKEDAIKVATALLIPLKGADDENS